MKIEQELTRMGIELPELDPAYDVKTYGMIVPHFNVENVLTLTAVPEIDARVIHPGRA